MSYKEATIYFLSGTGNSYRAAAWMAEAAREKGSAARVIPIKRGDPSLEVKDGPEHLLGLLTPTHGFITPWHMLRFALRLPRRAGTHAFVAATRAGTKAGPVFLPGLEGTAAYLLAAILALKGYRIRGATGLDMPSNWTALHWGISTGNSKAIIARNKPKALRFIGRILGGKTSFGGFISLFLGILLLPISIPYLLVGRFALSKVFFASERCTGCGVCANNCPTGAIRMAGRNRPRPYWTFTCESCMRCMNFCPVRAVEASWPAFAGIIYVSAIPVVVYLIAWLARRIPWLAAPGASWVGTVMYYAYLLASTYLIGLTLNLAARAPAINKLLTYTTITHYYRRYHEPDTRLSDLK